MQTVSESIFTLFCHRNLKLLLYAKVRVMGNDEGAVNPQSTCLICL